MFPEPDKRRKNQDNFINHTKRITELFAHAKLEKCLKSIIEQRWAIPNSDPVKPVFFRINAPQNIFDEFFQGKAFDCRCFLCCFFCVKSNDE